MIKPIEEIDYRNIRKELKNVGSFIESNIEEIIDIDPSLECTVLISKAREITYRIDSHLNSPLVIELKKLYEEAVETYAEVKTLNLSLG